MPPANHTNPPNLPSLNDRIAIFWPIDDQFFPGVVTELTHDGKVVVHYDDGDVETLLLDGEVWKFETSKPHDRAREPIPHTSTPAATSTIGPVSHKSQPTQCPLPTGNAEGTFVQVGKKGITSHARSTTASGSDSSAAVPGSRKRGPPSSVSKPVAKKPVTEIRQVSVKNSQKNHLSVPVSAAVGSKAPIATGITAPSDVADDHIVDSAAGSESKKKPGTGAVSQRVSTVPITVTYNTGQSQLARPITSGVPLSNNTQSLPPLPSLSLQPVESRIHEPPPNFQDALEPLMTSFNAQLNTQVIRISAIQDMLLNLSPRLSELDERCKTLRADVDNLESEVTSRAEMHKLLNAAFVKQMDELNRSQAVLLERLKMDFRQFLEGEMKAVEKHLVEEIRTKSAEVFKELFRGVAESIKDTAVKNAIEDMSIPTCPSKNSAKRKGGGPSRS